MDRAPGSRERVERRLRPSQAALGSARISASSGLPAAEGRKEVREHEDSPPFHEANLANA